jgi:sigma-B regulation protein RsbU (phosphoserine phosphatase)
MGTASSSMFITMFYGIYDRDTKVFRYSNAGHNPPLYVDKKSSHVRLLGPHGCPLGIMEDQPYGQDEIKLEKGDTMVLYTDGVVEAMNEKQEMFGLKRLSQVVLDSKDLSAQEIVNNIKEEAFGFSKNQSQFDDFTLLVFRVC